MGTFEDRCRELIGRAEGAGWSVVSERAIPYGRMFVLGRGGGPTATLNCYHGKKGFRQVVGGAVGDELEADLGGVARRPEAPAGPDPFGLGTPRVGADEAGKGDYFGPLVVAAWRLDAGGEDALARLGVADSKALSNARVQRLAGELEAVGAGAVRALPPPLYNERYARTRNLNVLLAELHAECIRELVASGGPAPRVVLVDRFARDERVLARALALPAGCRLVTRPRGEADPAVAAASILARASFLDGLRELEHEYGQPFPAGAGAPVDAAGRAFVRTFGRERLAEVAKVHFATTRKL